MSLGSWLTYSGGIEADATRACTEAAFEAGVNFFATANVYGQGAAETAWGEILSSRPRDSYILATKVYFPMSDDPADQGLSAAQIAQQIDASERRHPGPRRRPVTEPTLAPGAQPGVQHR
ncbi:aldo/keto reductase [Streptomyces sp. MK5]|uniref:aldo/keto reductase n=1 Tax=Streptomyces sp. MK5 TaxID=3064253 RepID=UPI002741A2AD|nr:aldo/keto reductase [Streptomyces sp. MK5]